MRNLLNIIIILCVCLDWCFAQGAGEREGTKADFHTIKVSSLFPSSSCVPSSKASNLKSSLRVVHMHGACSHLRKNKDARIDHDDIFRRNQARVDSIQSQYSKNIADQVTQSHSTELPAKSGLTIGSGNYIVTIGIGTPKHDLSLIFDTGSRLSWTQCEPCLGSCYSQKEPKFNPSSSSSYHSVSCSSPMCETPASCSASNCLYEVRYGDNSITQGFLATEKFTLTNSDVFDGVYFGCGVNNTGTFKGAAGLLGLSRSKISFPSQTVTTYNNIFSYCLPSTPSGTGHLTFGSSAISQSVKFTSMSSSSSHYGIDIIGISVGDKKLEISSTVFSPKGAIIDSGTVITYLPPTVYAELRSVFKEKMSKYKISSTRSNLLDTCYDFTGVDTMTVPNIVFSFAGGAVVELNAIGILYPFNESMVCLAFAEKRDGIPTIFGNVQQKTLEIVHDAAGGRVGFVPNACS